MLTEIAVASDYGERTHTPTVVDAVLPLPELMPREASRPDDDQYRGGGVANVGDHTILWRAVNRELTLELANLNGPRNGFHVISFVAPGPILAYCTSICNFEGTHFVLDFMLRSGFLYTVVLPYSCFESWNPPKYWRTVKCPFGVDCVTPFSLISRNPLELVASLADGTVSRLSRPEPLAELEIFPLNDPKEPGFLQRLIGNHKDQVPGYPGLASRAGIDLCSFNDNIVSLSVDGSIRVWSTASNTLVKTLPNRSQHKLTTTPSNYFHIVEDLLCVFTNGEFCVYDSSLELINVFGIPEHLQSWYMVDYTFTSDKQVVAAFKAAQNSQIWCIEQDDAYSISTQKPTISRIPDQREMQRFIDNIFSVKSYSSMTLRKALATFTNANESDIANLTVSAPPASAHSLRDAITETIQKQASVDKSDYRLQWIRFDSLCQEYESQLNEVFAVGKSLDGLIWSVRAAYYTLLCPISNIQRALSLDQGSATGILELIKKLYEVFLPANIIAFEDELHKNITNFATWGSELVPSRILRIYETCILPYIDERSVLEIRNSLVNIEDVDSSIHSILSECLIKDPTADTENDTLTPLGCSALSTIALNHAENSLKFVAKVLFFTLFAFGEGRTKDHLQIYATGLGHLRTSWAVISLQEPLDSSTTRFNRQTTAIEVSVSQLNLRVLDFNSLIARLWHKLDFTDPENLHLVLGLIKEQWSSNSLLNAVQFLGDDAESMFVKGLAKLAIKEQQEIGENIVRALAPHLSIDAPNLNIIGFGQGIPKFFLTVTNLCREIGIPSPVALSFIKLAARYDTESIEICTTLLDLALVVNNHVLAYEAICGLRKRNDPNISQHLEQFLDATISQRTMDYVCKELVFPGLVELVPEILAKRSTIGGLPTFKLLYVWCINRRNYLEAAKAVYQHIHGVDKSDGNSLNLYTITLNALQLVDEQDRWFVVEKQIVTENDIQKEYQNIYQKV